MLNDFCVMLIFSFSGVGGGLFIYLYIVVGGCDNY